MIEMLRSATAMKISVAVLMAALLMFVPVTTASAALGGINVPVQIPLPTGTVQGIFNITSFAVQNGQLVAVGTVNFAYNGAQQVVRTAAPVTQATGSCTILDLTIGPIHLNLLGLNVDTNTIHLSITAQQGAGNLLGNLLCAVANLLNGGLGSLTGGALQNLANLLTGIIAAL